MARPEPLDAPSSPLNEQLTGWATTSAPTLRIFDPRSRRGRGTGAVSHDVPAPELPDHSVKHLYCGGRCTVESGRMKPVPGSVRVDVQAATARRAVMKSKRLMNIGAS